MWLEIFKTGSHTDSNGRSQSYTPETLDLIAAKYNSQILDDPAMAAPVVKGHPQTDSPAFGWVERLARRGDKLIAFVRDINNDFAEEVRDGKFKKISIALYPDMLLKHVGFLGAAAPAVNGLMSPSFSEVNNGPEFQISSEPDKVDANNNIESLENENIRLRKELELLHKAARLKQYREFADSLVAGPNGSVITPAQTDFIVDLLEMANRESVSEGSSYNSKANRVVEIMEFFKTLKPVFTTNEFAVGKHHLSVHSDEFAGVQVSDKRIELHEAARQMQSEEPGLSYEEAVLIAQRNKL